MLETLEEEDFSLIHALQLRPRASWAHLADALSSSPVTLARRWERLREGGAAWVTAYPHVSALPQIQAAYVEIRCASGQVRDLIRELRTWPSVASIEEASREYSLVLTVFGLGMRDLSTLLLDAIPSLPGVLNTRSHLASRLHVEGSSWRVGALDRTRVQAVSQLPPAGSGRPAAVEPWKEPYAPLTIALGEDGRRSAADLARITGRPVSTVRRQLGHLLSADALTFRCEIAQGLTPSPIVVNWWCQVPVAHVSTCVDRLRANPALRQVASLPGPANLLVTTWMRSIEESMRMQEHLEQGLAPLSVLDSALILRTVKRMGWLLDDLGRSTGFVATMPAQRDRR
ncbi:Lrp/AsnC family transcriptional regulator [Amycolatopsis benzoatilytica]|uniref:Lrp/AsnC family transcriptional regulator n=1 Tax=Amycolatopsis benzoatilytica TaxID=346045 RepID=UPI000371B455|nr:Lrp/AsnC family transcriptional regulator [Amycolatopsis benzoatilytica]